MAQLNFHGKKGGSALRISPSDSFTSHYVLNYEVIRIANFSTQSSVIHSLAYVGTHHITLQLFQYKNSLSILNFEHHHYFSNNSPIEYK